MCRTLLSGSLLLVLLLSAWGCQDSAPRTEDGRFSLIYPKVPVLTQGHKTLEILFRVSPEVTSVHWIWTDAQGRQRATGEVAPRHWKSGWLWYFVSQERGNLLPGTNRFLFFAALPDGQIRKRIVSIEGDLDLESSS